MRRSLLLLAFACAASAHADPVVWGDSLDAARTAAKASGKPVLALFWTAEWGACPLLDGALRDAAVDKLVRAFEPVVVDFAADREARTVYRGGRFQLLVLAADGREVARWPYADRTAPGDPRALERELAWALDEAKRAPEERIALPTEGRDRIGLAAPEWQPEKWTRGGPFTLAGLRDRVVLIRFFTHT